MDLTYVSIIILLKTVSQCLQFDVDNTIIVDKGKVCVYRTNNLKIIPDTFGRSRDR